MSGLLPQANVARWGIAPGGQRVPVPHDCALCKSPEAATYFALGLWLCAPCYQRRWEKEIAP